MIIKKIDVMKDYGRVFYHTLRNVIVIPEITVLPTGESIERYNVDSVYKSVKKRMPSIDGRNDIRLVFDL